MDRRTIKARQEVLDTLEGLTKAYAEISSTRMKKTRSSVLTSRDYLGSLDEIFKDVRESYKREVLKLVKKKKGQDKVTFLAHNGKTISVFVSANTGLYGDLVSRVFNEFIKEVREKGTEVTIIGKLGLSQFLSAEPKRPYTYFDYPDYGGSKEDLGDIIKHLVQYEEIHVFHGLFKNVVYQEPTVLNISAGTPLEALEVDEKNVKKFLFEPSLEEILVFFETEMFTSSFEHALSESQLAKFASRMISMDKAGENIREEAKKAKLDLLRMTHYVANKKQQSAFVSVSLWNK